MTYKIRQVIKIPMEQKIDMACAAAGCCTDPLNDSCSNCGDLKFYFMDRLRHL